VGMSPHLLYFHVPFPVIPLEVRCEPSPCKAELSKVESAQREKRVKR
jgi:hypothetical protein